MNSVPIIVFCFRWRMLEDSLIFELSSLAPLILAFICIQACDRPNLKKTEETYIYDIHTEEGLGVLEICQVLADSILFKQ